MKLRTKASLFLSILLVAVFLGQVIYFYYFLEKALLRQAQQRQEEIVSLLGERLDAGIRTAQTDLLNIAAHLDFSWIKEEKHDRLESYLESASYHNSNFDNGFFILNAQGQGLADYPIGMDFLGKDFSFREYFQKTRDEKRPVISKTYISKRTGAPVITFTAPLRSYDGKFFGLIAGSVNLLRDNMFGIFKGNRIGQTGKILIYDSRGQLIFHPDPGIIMNQARLSGYRISPELFPQKGAGTICLANRDENEVWISFYRMAGVDWIVALQTESREILAPLKSLRREVVLALLLALIAAIGLGIWGMGILVRPIQALSHSIRQFKGETWEEPPGILTRSDEIGELGRNFREMSGKLNESLHSLGESEGKYRALVEGSLVGVFLIQKDRFAFVNPRLGEIFGYTPEELISLEDVYELVAPKERERVRGLIGNLESEPGEMAHFIWEGIRKDGRPIQVEVIGTGLNYRNEPAMHGALLDISERRRIETDLQEKKEQLEFHYALSEEVNRSLDLNTLLNRAVEMIIRKFQVPMIGILILNEGTRELEYLVQVGYPPDHIRDHNKIPLGQGASGQAARTGESLVVPDYGNFPQALLSSQEKGGIGSIAVFPLKIQERVIGILNIAYPEPQAFSPDEIDFFQQLAPILAGAINNARIYQETQHLNQALVELSRMDGLTGAFNRRYLEERLSEEINRCRRLGGYLGLMMIDVDHFKQINDTFGHGVGDQVLKEVAGLIQKSCRNIDIVGRYGGDEFLVILIETTESEALKIAERIEQKAREVAIPPHKPLLGLSIGVASRNSDYEGILKIADDRMYAQKRMHSLHP